VIIATAKALPRLLSSRARSEIQIRKSEVLKLILKTGLLALWAATGATSLARERFHERSIG
jgi:hypothetical protein